MAKRSLMKVRGEFPEELLKWVTSPAEEITEEVERAIDRVLKDRKKRAQVFLTALARKRIERIVYLMGKAPLVENELFRENRVKTARTSDLIRLLSVIGVQVHDASEFLRMFVSDEELKAEHLPTASPKEITVETVGEEDKKAVREISAEGRQRLVRVLRKVMGAVDAATAEEAKKELPEPKKK